MKQKILSFLVLFMLSVASFAQNGTMTYPYTADRPGYSNSPYLVGLHQLAIESGFGCNLTETPTSKTFYNQNLFRYGMFKHLEFRAQIDFGATSSDTSFYGVKTINLGFKIPIIRGYKYLPDIGILGTVALPKVGNLLYSSSDYTPALTLLLQKNFSNFSLGCNAGVFWDSHTIYEDSPFINPYSTGHYIQGSFSLIASYAIQNVSIFAESYEFYSVKTNPYIAFDMGFAYSILPKLQFDISVGSNLKLDNSFVAIGIAWRIPNKYR